jgi:hypothetical protein
MFNNRNYSSALLFSGALALAPPPAEAFVEDINTHFPGGGTQFIPSQQYEASVDSFIAHHRGRADSAAADSLDYIVLPAEAYPGPRVTAPQDIDGSGVEVIREAGLPQPRSQSPYKDPTILGTASVVWGMAVYFFFEILNAREKQRRIDK